MNSLILFIAGVTIGGFVLLAATIAHILYRQLGGVDLRIISIMLYVVALCITVLCILLSPISITINT